MHYRVLKERDGKVNNAELERKGSRGEERKRGGEQEQEQEPAPSPTAYFPPADHDISEAAGAPTR